MAELNHFASLQKVALVLRAISVKHADVVRRCPCGLTCGPVNRGYVLEPKSVVEMFEKVANAVT